MEAIPLLFDYQDDKQFFKDLNGNAGRISEDEMLLMLNYRSIHKNFACLVDGCNEPLWTLDYNIYNGVDRLKHLYFKKMLTHYTCGEHLDMYELVTIDCSTIWGE